ncbi:MAG TPA: hypothetical protein VFQ91_27475 [Bryobacteraceae bacterium]|nr:hypothetical protein [Bryobacteraceae bacterium]
MPDSFFEDATITISENLTRKKFRRTKPYSGPAKINFFKGDEASPFHTATVEVVDGNLNKAFKHKMPAVEKKEEFYALRATCEYKKISKPLLTAMIWPKTTQVLFQDQGKQPMKAFNFLVKQQGEPDQRLATDGQGKCTVTLMARAPYSIVPDGKFKLLSDEQATAGQFRDHKITVETVITAKFSAPDITKSYYVADPDAAPAKKQWINLPSKEKDHDVGSGCEAQGKSIVFAVTADPPEDGQVGDKVYFEVTFGRESKRKDPLPCLRAEFPVSDKKVVENKATGYVILSPLGDNPTGYFEVDLGIAGGDTCTVKIGGTPAVADAEMKLINWRKLYGQVTKAAGMTVPALGPVTAAFKKVFVDFEESKADEVVLQESALPSGAMVENSIINGSGTNKILVIGDHNVDWFENKINPRFKKDSLPVIHLIYCAEQIDGDKTPFTGDATISKTDKISYPGGGKTAGIVIEGNSGSGDDSGYIYPKDLRDNSSGVKSVTWEEQGGTGANGTITDADYKFKYDSSVGNQLYIRLPAAAKSLSDNGSSIKISYEVAWAEGDNNGWCTDRNVNVIALGRADVDICATIIHEIGHAINQTTPVGEKSLFPGLKPPHKRWYDWGRGHSGNHCADGLDDKSYKNASFVMDDGKAAKVCSCVMFGSTGSRTNKLLDFCSHCKPFVHAAKIETIST